MARSQVFTALLLAIISTAAGQYFQSGGTCCDLMDSDGWVILEHLNPIGEGRFNTLYIKLCSTSPVSVQLWEPSGNDWLLAWEKEYQIVDPSLAGEWAEISVADFDLTPEHRLGIYAKGSETIPVPYDYTTGTEPLSRSVENWYTPQFNIYNQDKSFTNIHFERSFINYVRFCYSGGEETECLNGNVPSVVVVAGPSGPQGPTGVPGPEGPVGPQGPPGAVCFLPDSGILFPPGASDVTDSVQNALGQIEANNAALSDKLDEISAAFANSNLLTGSCPPGFVSGSYGLGYCYLFMDNVQLSFGEALQHCHENYGALPVIIDSSLEEAFISTKIIQQMKDVEEDRMVWTAGLWSGDIDTWVWYSEMVETKKPMTYTNWLAGEPDLGLDGDQVCVAMSVIRGEDEGPYSYWTSEDCVRRNYFVCKIPKSCY